MSILENIVKYLELFITFGDFVFNFGAQIEIEMGSFLGAKLICSVANESRTVRESPAECTFAGPLGATFHPWFKAQKNTTGARKLRDPQ